jgi:hypothetical protein
MKHNIVKTENYLLVLDDSEIKVGDWFYLNDANIIAEYISVKPVNEAKKITAHLPLNNSPVLEGVPLLPPLEDDNEEVWEQGLLAELEKLPYTKHLDDGQYNDGQLVGFQFGATWGYNKAKEKYKYTEEDLRNAIDMARKFPYITKGEIKFNTPIDEIIKFIQQPKIPVAFECEWTTKQMPEFHQDEPKTITNPQGQTVLVGKYIH